MESKHKNALIVALLAVVLVMAVGYAAYAQQLTINSKATIQESTVGTKNWNVLFDQSKTTDYVVSKVSGGSLEPTANISFDGASNTTATISATLNTPGDKVVYTFTVLNEGSINATLTQPVLALTNDGSDTHDNPATITYNNVVFSVSTLGTTALPAKTGTTTFKVTAQYDPNTTTVTSGQKTASIQVTFTANQSA